MSDALNGVEIVRAGCDMGADVARVSNDSRNITRGSVFVAVMGADSGIHRIRFARAAMAAGAVCVVCDVDCDDDIP